MPSVTRNIRYDHSLDALYAGGETTYLKNSSSPSWFEFMRKDYTVCYTVDPNGEFTIYGKGTGGNTLIYPTDQERIDYRVLLTVCFLPCRRGGAWREGTRIHREVW